MGVGVGGYEKICGGSTDWNHYVYLLVQGHICCFLISKHNWILQHNIAEKAHYCRTS